MKIEIDISDERIDELLTGHRLESWLDSATDEVGDWKNGTLQIKYDLEHGGEGDMEGRKTVSRADVRRGLAVMAEKAAWAFARWMEGNDDRPACDAAWQCIIFGRLVYS